MATKPVTPISSRACCTALVHLPSPELLNCFFPAANCFLLTTLPDMLSIRSFLRRPPLVLSAVPLQTRLMDPTMAPFFLARFAFLLPLEARVEDRFLRLLLRVRRRGALGVLARRADERLDE